jgi:hypothetical protein
MIMLDKVPGSKSTIPKDTCHQRTEDSGQDQDKDNPVPKAGAKLVLGKGKQK